MVEIMPWIGAISFDLGPAPVLKEIQRKDLPVRFAGRAFLCRGRGEPDHRGRHVLRAGQACRAPAEPGPMPTTWSSSATRARPSVPTVG